MDTDDLAAALRACAEGIYSLEAGVVLLIANGTFLRRDDFTSRFVDHGDSLSDGTTPMAVIDWDAAITALKPANSLAPAGNGASSSSQPASPQASPSASETPSPDLTTATPPGCSQPSATRPEND